MGTDTREPKVRDYKVVKYTNELYSAYKKFAKLNFGRYSYQSQAEYIEWLYNQNPFSGSYDNFLIVLDEFYNIVGCVHTLAFKARSLSNAENVIDIKSVHNLMVDKNHRNGVGFLLLMSILKQKKPFMVPAVVGDLSKSYKNLGCDTIRCYWGAKSLIPHFKAFLKRVSGISIDSEISKIDRFANDSGIVIESFETQYLCDFLSRHSGGFIISQDFIKWRLFTQKKSIFILWDAEKTSLVVIAIGKRSGVPIARVVLTVLSGSDKDVHLMRASLNFCRFLGCCLLLITSASDCFENIASQLNIKKRKISPDTYFHYQKYDIETTQIFPLFTDIGFSEQYSGL